MKALIVAAALLCMTGCDSRPIEVPAKAPGFFQCQELLEIRDAALRAAVKSSFNEERQADATLALAANAAVSYCVAPTQATADAR